MKNVAKNNLWILEYLLEYLSPLNIKTVYKEE